MRFSERAIELKFTRTSVHPQRQNLRQ